MEDYDTFAVIEGPSVSQTPSELLGYVVLGYDVSGTEDNPDYDPVSTAWTSGNCTLGLSYPDPSESSPSCLGVGATPAQVKEVLEGTEDICLSSEVSGTGCIDVSFEYTEGPGINWVITFARGTKTLGTRPLLTAALYDTTGALHSDGTATVERVQPVRRHFLFSSA